VLLLLPGVLGVFFFFSARSFSSSSRFSRSMSVISVLQRRCSSSAVRDLMNQSKRNCGDALHQNNTYIYIRIIVLTRCQSDVVSLTVWLRVALRIRSPYQSPTCAAYKPKSDPQFLYNSCPCCCRTVNAAGGKVRDSVTSARAIPKINTLSS